MIEIIRDPIEIDSLLDVWNEVAERLKTPLLRHEWFAACAKAYCQHGQLYVMLNRSRRGIDAIAPLVLAHKHAAKTLELLGTNFLGEPSGLIYRDEHSLEELINGIIRMRQPLILSRLKSESPEVLMLRRMYKKHSIFVLRDSTAAPYLPITSTWTEFETNMSSRSRYDLRRARKRVENFGKVQFEIVSPDLEMLDYYLEEIFRVESAGWKGRTGTAILYDERMKHFFYLYSKATSRLGTLRLCFLRINNQSAAVLLGVEYFNRFWVLKIGYDETFSRCSPGVLLIHETIHYAFDNKLEAYEFLGDDSPWIHMWTTQKHPCVTARIYPFSLSGQLSFGRDATSSIVNRVLRQMGK
jgi:CelD/BcsL family acetyltransferase involved in cellulose biosynthesis